MYFKGENRLKIKKFSKKNMNNMTILLTAKKLFGVSEKKTNEKETETHKQRKYGSS